MPNDFSLPFSAPLALANLAGLKTQSRRPFRTQPSPDFSPVAPCGWYTPLCVDKKGFEYPGDDVYGIASEDEGYTAPACPGDILWMRENFATLSGFKIPLKTPQPILYMASVDMRYHEDYTGRPSIHMPRWASRFVTPLIEVSAGRAEEISEADAIAEGFVCTQEDRDHGRGHADLFRAWWRNAYPGKEWCWIFKWAPPVLPA